MLNYLLLFLNIFLSFFDKIFPISSFLGKYNKEKHNLKMEEKPGIADLDRPLSSGYWKKLLEEI